jgi:hypothetical protein
MTYIHMYKWKGRKLQKQKNDIHTNVIGIFLSFNIPPI